MRLTPTPSQTVGPFFSIGMHTADVIAEPGVERLSIRGRVFDGDGKGIDDAVIETWQARSDGCYADRSSREWGRVATDSSGSFQFSTTKPGRVAGAGAELPAPHLVVTIFARGLLKHLVTRIYFEGETSNANDPILGAVPVNRRPTLIARSVGPNEFEWNVVLQGENETVFFEY